MFILLLFSVSLNLFNNIKAQINNSKEPDRQNLFCTKYIRNIVPLSLCLFSGTACFLCEILTMSNGCKIKLLLGKHS